MVTIVAEIASAHEGKLKQMFRLIDAAKASSADAVKFQIYKAEMLCVRRHPFYDLYKQLEYSENHWGQIIHHAHQLQLQVLADVFDSWGLQVMERYAVEGYKVHSTISSEEDLLAKVASTGKPVYLGVGGVSLREINKALEILCRNGAQKITLIHGFQLYPTEVEDTNLLRIATLKRHFKLPIGFADHVDAESQLALMLPLVAVGFGVDAIEKHITLDRSKKGPDYYSALNPSEFSGMVSLIREVEMAVGNGSLTSPAERRYIESGTRRIVATDRIEAGEFITPEKIAFKRSSENGLLPSKKQKILYKKAKKSIESDEAVTMSKVDDIGVGVLVAVRMKSTRLPRKALIEIQGKTIIEHLLERVKAARMPNVVVVCTSTHPDDAILIDIAKKARVKWFAGSEEDVMERFLGAARQERVDIIVRVTGDCPLVDPEYIDKAIAHLAAKDADYVRVVNMPIGTGCEVFTTKALEKADNYAIDPNYSEYMSFYFLNNPEMFHIEEVECDESVKRPDYRLTIDQIADIHLMEEIYQRLYQGGRIFPLKEVMELLDSNPKLVEINKATKVKWRDDKEFVDFLSEKTRLRAE